MRSALFLAATSVFTLAGCGGGDDQSDEPCSPAAQTGCDQGQVCEQIQGGEVGCFAPVTIQGQVFDVSDDSAVSGATVVARDANGAAISQVTVTAADGSYELPVPVTRDADGNPLPTSYTLRVDAAGFQKFPTAPRVALPIDVSLQQDGVVDNTATAVGLIPLPSVDGLGTISGSVDAPLPGGTLVVANGVTGIADRSGDFTIFNVPAGSVDVEGYLLGHNLQSASVDVTAGETTSGVQLSVLGDQAATVSGKVSLVNPGAGSETSVILVVASTFNENLARGETPAGLRAANVSGDFSIAGVPDGEYFALAAFENDLLVRDPDTSQGGTAIVGVSVAAADTDLGDSFKVTGCLDVISPDGEEVVSGTPTFEWEDDSGEASYAVSVFDAFGNLVWELDAIPPVSGNVSVSVPYAGPALTSGLLYQFRATSFKQGGAPISTTEDLRGVFFYQ